MNTECSGEDYHKYFNDQAYLQEFHTDIFTRTDQIADLWHGVVNRLHDTFKQGMAPSILLLNPILK